MKTRLGAAVVGIAFAGLVGCATAPGMAPGSEVAPSPPGGRVVKVPPGGAPDDVARYDTDAATETLTAGRRYPLLVDAQRGLVIGAGTATIGTVTIAEPVDASGTAGTAIQQGAGAATAATVRTVTATDSADVASLGTIDNIVFAEDALHMSGDSGVQALHVATDAAPAVTGAAGDYEPAVITALNAYRTVQQPERYVDSLGAVYLVATAFTTVTTAGAAEIQPVAAQGAGNSVLLLGYQVSSSVSQTTMQFESDDSDSGITLQAQAATSWTTDMELRAIGETADNQALKLQVSTAATVSVQVWYIVR